MASTLTQDDIKEFREWAFSAEPYTDAEINKLRFDESDDDDDFARWLSYMGRKVLNEYGIPLTEESDEHE